MNEQILSVVLFYETKSFGGIKPFNKSLLTACFNVHHRCRRFDLNPPHYDACQSGKSADADQGLGKQNLFGILGMIPNQVKQAKDARALEHDEGK